MEFTLRWTENKRAGNVTVNGENIAYSVLIPVSVELILSRDIGCPSSPPTDNPNSSSDNAPIPLPDGQLNGQAVTAELLSQTIGGKQELWIQKSSYVWTYSDKGNNISFKHPGGETIITYWAGFADPSNSSECTVVQPPVDSQAKYIKCPTGTHEFVADQIGFHLIDEAGYFN